MNTLAENAYFEDSERPELLRTSVPLLGRAGVFTQRKIFQLFAQIRDINLIFQTPDRNLLPEGWMVNYLPQSPGECGDGLAPRMHGKCERLWRMGTGCQVAYRSGAGPFTPLSTSQFDAFDNPDAPDPAGAVSGGSGYFRARYTISTLTGRDIFFLDIGQTVETYALQVNANIVGPPGSISITAQNDSASAAPAQLTGLVIDVRIGAVFEPIEAPTGLREGKYTQIIPVPLATIVTVPVPKFARAVRIYQDALGAGSGPWRRFVGPAGGLDVGQIAFAGRASQEVDGEIGRESSLITDANLINARLFQVIWTIRP